MSPEWIVPLGRAEAGGKNSSRPQPEKDFISHVFRDLKMLLGCDVVCVSCLGRWELGAGRVLGCVDDVMGGGGGAL